jgi:hypothetical protein
MIMMPHAPLGSACIHPSRPLSHKDTSTPPPKEGLDPPLHTLTQHLRGFFSTPQRASIHPGSTFRLSKVLGRGRSLSFDDMGTETTARCLTTQYWTFSASRG